MNLQYEVPFLSVLDCILRKLGESFRSSSCFAILGSAYFDNWFGTVSLQSWLATFPTSTCRVLMLKLVTQLVTHMLLHVESVHISTKSVYWSVFIGSGRVGWFPPKC